MGFFRELNKFVSNPFGYVEKNVLKPIERAVIRPIGEGIESGFSSITKTLENVLRDPLPTLMQIGGSMIGIPPYVTAAAITAVKGGDLEDIAKSAAISYAATNIMQSDFGEGLKNFTQELGGDFTNLITEKFDIQPDTAMAIQKAAVNGLNTAVVGGINAAISGKDILQGITGGLTQGIVYSGTDSFFNDVNENQNWGLTDKTLNLIKGATSSALNAAISGKGDPAAAIGNYITNAVFNQGKTELNIQLKKAYEDFTLKQSGVENARAEYEAQEKAYKEQVDQYNSLVDQTARAKAKADKLAVPINMANQQAIDNYNFYLPRYNEKIAQLEQMGRDYGYYVSVDDIDNANRIANLYPFIKLEAETIKQHHLDYNSWFVTTVLPADLNKIYAETNILQQETDKIYKNIAEPGQVDKGAYGFTDGGGEAGAIATWFPNIEDNLAAKLQKASENLNNAYDEYKISGQTVEDLSEKNILQIAQIATRDATIDAVNQGLIKATKIGDNKFELSNGMILDNGQFYQNDQPLFGDVSYSDQNNLQFIDDQGGTAKYGNKGQLLSYVPDNEVLAKNAGFPDYKTYELYSGNANEYKANQAGWESFADQQDAAKYEITSPQKYNEFLSGKTEEDRISQMLMDRGITPSPERVADIMVAWNFNPATPSVGFTEALNKSDKINIANSRADTVQEAAALAKSLGYTNFAFGGSEYKINPQASTANPYNFFAGFDDAFKAARADLGPGKNFEWTNPATGETKTFTTNNQKEQAVADQKRIDLMPAYTGEGAYTRTGNPGIVPEIYFDKNTGNVVQDTRVWDENGKLVGGEVKNINPNESGSTTEKLAASIKESFGKTFDAFKYVTSGLNKGGWELLNQVGVLGGLTGLVDMDNWATRTAKEMKSVIDGYQNKEFLNNKELMYKAIEKAGDAGIFAQAVEAAKQFGVNPLQTAEFIAQQGASLLLGGGAMATARALGAGLTGQQAAAIGTMAAAQGASVADEAYRDALKNNKTPEEAINAARVAWAGAALTSAVSNKFIPGALSNESLIAAQNIAKTSLRNALKGEMSTELVEETSGKIIGNLAAGNAWDKDLGSTAVQALIGSGGVTGLVQMAPISNPETAILIAKDAGVTDQKFDDIKNVFSGTVGTQNFNLPQAKEQIIEILGSSNLNPDYFTQVSDLIARDAIKDAVFTNFEKAGVPLDKIDEVANLTATQIFNNENPQTAISDVSNALQSSGLDPLQASLIANQTLTGTDVRKVVADQFKAIGYTPTQEEINNLIGQNVLAKPADINLSVESYTAPRFVTKEEAKEALTASGIKNPADALVNSLVGQYDQSSLTSKAEEIGKNPLTQILNNIASQQNAPLDISALQKSLSDQIAANEATGLSRDAATTKAIDDVALNLNITKEAVTAQIQNTKDILSGQIAANEKAGLDRDAATNKAITDLSTRMGVDREAFLTGLGTTEERLKGEFTTGLTGLTGQISDLQKQIEEQQKEEEERQRQEQERQKVEAARSLVSSARNAAEQRMTSGAAAMSALAALGSVGRGAPDEFKPLLPQFLTSKGGQTGYKGLLEDFQQQVEGRTDMFDNQSGQLSQLAQESQESKDMAPYYSYGNETSLDQILGQEAESQQFAAGGLAQPLMTAGTRYGKYAAGGMPSPLMAAGGKMRVDFRDGDAVTGPGDGQSDDIPAMLADGEFVFPADVVAAIGNGSTKAGSDKLYDMMHSIRSHVRSAKPQDLPPEIKSPLDFLKASKKSSKTRRA